MRIEFERFLAMTALLAGATALAAACTITSDDSANEGGSPGVVGAGGKGGTSAGQSGSSGQAGTAGKAGSAGQAGQGGQGGTAGQAGSGGYAGDASVCLGDMLPTDWDAGSAPCEILPYKTTCTGGALPLAYDVCTYLDDGTSHTRARKGIAGEVARCFSKITGDACNDSVVQPKAEQCLAEVFPQACGKLAPIPIGGGQTVTCQDLVDTCTLDGGTANLTVQDCELSLNAFQPWAQGDIANCFLDIMDSGNCKDDFDYCVFPP